MSESEVTPFSLDEVATFMRIWSCVRPYICEDDKPDVCLNMLSYFNLNEGELRFEASDANFYEIKIALDKLDS